MILSTYLVGLCLHGTADAGLAQKCCSGWLKHTAAVDTGVSGQAVAPVGRKERGI